jgi:hypothetical protein
MPLPQNADGLAEIKRIFLAGGSFQAPGKHPGVFLISEKRINFIWKEIRVLGKAKNESY